jgi:predicted flap endonuclease-1-like 5' DNA nuclease
MNLDSNTLLIVGGVIAVLILLLFLLRGRGRQRVQLRETDPSPLLRRTQQDGPEGNAVTDEYSAATRDVAGEILGVEAHPVAAAPGGPADDLKMLKGVGPKLAALLNENGITRYDQLAGLSETEVAILDERMGAFRGRLARDRIVEQACFLARGDRDGFEAQFGKLGGA